MHWMRRAMTCFCCANSKSYSYRRSVHCNSISISPSVVVINDDDKDDKDDKDNKDDEDDKLINMPSSFVICKENLKTSLLDCEEKWKALSYEKRVEFYATYKAELNIKT